MKFDLGRSAGRRRTPQHSQAIDTLQNLIHDYEKSHCRLAHTHHPPTHAHPRWTWYLRDKKKIPATATPGFSFCTFFSAQLAAARWKKWHHAHSCRRIFSADRAQPLGVCESRWVKKTTREVGKIKIKIEQSDKKKRKRSLFKHA